MGYSVKDGEVRVDFFKPSGKWYTTESLDMDTYYMTGTVADAVKLALQDHLRVIDYPVGEKARERFRLAGMTAVVLEPFHRNAHPVMVKIPEEGEDW